MASPIPTSSTSPSHRRRPSLQLPDSSPLLYPSSSSPRVIPTSSPRAVPIPSPRAVPLPVPQRHGSIVGSYGSMTDFSAFSPRHRANRGSMSGSMSGSASLGNSFVLGPSVTDDLDTWLDVTAADVIKAVEASDTVVTGDHGLEKATEVLIRSKSKCLLVQTGGGYGLFDFADLNTVLLLVLISSTKGPFDSLDERSRELVEYLQRGIRFGIGAVCDISQKNPSHCFPPSTPLSRLLPVFASGVHRVVITMDPPTILSDAALLAHLSRKPPPLFRRQLSDVDLPLHQLISLPHTATVLDAMQVMSINGLSAIGVVIADPKSDPERESELGALIGVVTVTDCSKIVVPSEGKQALAVSLGEMCKNVQKDHKGMERGEERVPVHTITPSTSLLHAANLILATSSSRVFMRTPPASSPPLSPVSSLESPDLSSPISASVGLPTPPPTQFSSQYVISIVDILASLARSCSAKLTPVETKSGAESWDMLPDSVSKRRRRASSSNAISGFATWRWTGEPSPL